MPRNHAFCALLLPQKYQYRPTAGATSCLLCPRGTDTQDTGNVECTPCALGFYNGQEGGCTLRARGGHRLGE